MELNLVRIQINIAPQARQAACDCLLSGKGTVFEERLRHLLCDRPGVLCSACEQQQICLVVALTGRVLATDPELIRRHQKPGLPYMFAQSADDCSIRLTAVGIASQMIDQLVAAIRCCLGGSALHSLIAIDYQASPVVSGNTLHDTTNNLPVLSLSELFEQYAPAYLGCHKLAVTIQTPLRLMSSGRELSRFDAAVFVRALLRRLSSMVAYYGDFDQSDMMRSLADSTDHIRLVAVDRSDFGVYASMRGVTGRFVMSGPFEELGPYIMLGSILNLGKGAAYGMGQFSVVPVVEH